jgi:hypothetical protein
MDLNIVGKIRRVVELMREDSDVIEVMQTYFSTARISPENLATLPGFLPGHLIEIRNRLIAKEKDPVNKFLKYPCVALRLDIPELVRGDVVDYRLNIAILTYTNRNWSAEEREENVFVPILHPLYGLFMKSIKNSGLFQWQGLQKYPEHTKVDRYYWGTEGPQGNSAAMFADPLDAVEMLDLKLSSTINCEF